MTRKKPNDRNILKPTRNDHIDKGQALLFRLTLIFVYICQNELIFQSLSLNLKYEKYIDCPTIMNPKRIYLHIVADTVLFSIVIIRLLCYKFKVSSCKCGVRTWQR